MKAKIHPQYYQATVTCTCGNTYVVGSVRKSIDVEICSKCHPFFTGEQRFLDTMGRVERFQQKQQATAGVVVLSKKKKAVLKQKIKDAAEAAKPKSLKEMFDRVSA